ncbi:MAG: hypothetical protein GX146_11360 [Myxococcales bacterium]|nr:hypothetical protein [Myxococcales bacterium]
MRMKEQIRLGLLLGVLGIAMGAWVAGCHKVSDDGAVDDLLNPAVGFLSADEKSLQGSSYTQEVGTNKGDDWNGVDMDSSMDSSNSSPVDPSTPPPMLDGGEDTTGNTGRPTTEDGTVVEGDIYRVLSDRMVANLNAYRGLQLIDFADPAAPQVVGRYPTVGTPVEMYVEGDTAVVLYNNWQGYFGTRTDIAVENYSGGLVAAVDISDPHAPTLINMLPVPGHIVVSRMVTGDTQRALYVAARYTERGETIDAFGDISSWESAISQTVVKSFSLDAKGALKAKTELMLPGDISDIQATSRALLVARNDWSTYPQSCEVEWIDISNPTGEMHQGPAFQTAGTVRKKTDMSVHGDILRIVSGNQSGSMGTNYVETWNVADLDNPVAVDQKSFGAGENLYATLFLGNKAFFVTFLQVDPFHAFDIDDDGVITEKNEYVISGWNDFFKPAFNDERIVGIGRDNNALAVSLYNTDIELSDPFIARESLDNLWGDSEATWDDRAFTVLSDVVSVTSANGTEETGLVLLPFSSYDGRNWQAVHGVKVLTFSKDTLTLRGTMTHDAEVRRSFMAETDMVANLSEQTMDFFDFSDPAAPALLGSVDLAPWYSDFLVYGEYGVRVRTNPQPWYTRGNNTNNSSNWDILPPDIDVLPPKDIDVGVAEDIDVGSSEPGSPGGFAADPMPMPMPTPDVPGVSEDPQGKATEEAGKPGLLEIVSLSEPASTAPVLAQIEIASGARVFQMGDHAVAASSNEAEPGALWVEVIDLSKPLAPKKISEGSLALPDYRGTTGSSYRYQLDLDACYGLACRSHGSNASSNAPAVVVGDALVLPSLLSQSKEIGTLTRCYRYVTERDPGNTVDGDTVDSSDDWSSPWDTPGYKWYEGSVDCTRLNDGPEVCYGTIEECTIAGRNDGGSTDYMCTTVDPDSVETSNYCYEDSVRHYWSSYVFNIIDLSDAKKPVVRDAIRMAATQEAEGFVVDGSTLYANHSVPVTIADDERPWRRYYVTRIDLATPSAPNVQEAVNIPGAVFAVNGDQLITRDPVWTDKRVDTVLNTVVIEDGVARRTATRKFENQVVQSIVVDAEGHAFVTSGTQRPWWYSGYVGYVGLDSDYYNIVYEDIGIAWDSGDDDGVMSVPPSAPTDEPMPAIGTPRALVSGAAAPNELVVLDIGKTDMPLLSSLPIDSWTSLQKIAADRALFSVPGGLLIVNLDNVKAPFAQAYYPLQGWDFAYQVADQRAVLCAGRYGIQDFDLDEANLLAP